MRLSKSFKGSIWHMYLYCFLKFIATIFIFSKQHFVLDTKLIPKDICQSLCRRDCSKEVMAPTCGSASVIKNNEFLRLEKQFDNVCELKNAICETGLCETCTIISSPHFLLKLSFFSFRQIGYQMGSCVAIQMHYNFFVKIILFKN